MKDDIKLSLDSEEVLENENIEKDKEIDNDNKVSENDIIINEVEINTEDKINSEDICISGNNVEVKEIEIKDVNVEIEDTTINQNNATKNKKFKKFIIAVSVCVVIALGAILAFKFIKSGPKSIIKNVKIEFKGVDGRGIAEYNQEELYKILDEIIVDKYGISIDQLKFNIEGGQKVAQAIIARNSIVFSLDKYRDLSNGDKVVFSIKSYKEDSPILEESKEFIVSGLSELQKVSTEEFMEGYPIEIRGYNGFGFAVYDDVIYEKIDNNRLSNGDKINVEVKKSIDNMLENDGKKLEKHKFDIEIKGLPEFKNIENLNTLLTKVDELADNKSKGVGIFATDIEAQRIEDYVKLEYSKFDDKLYISIASLYRVKYTEKRPYDEKTEEKVEYYLYGFDRLYTDDNSFVLSELDNYFRQLNINLRTEDEKSAKSVAKEKGYISYNLR